MTKKSGYRFIVRTDGIRRGRAILEGTRIAVHDVIGLLQEGETVDSVLECLEGLSKEQVEECLAFYEVNRQEIDRLVKAELADDEEE